MSSSRRERVFIVRLWTASVAPGAEWRGSVQDVAERRTFYVASPREVADYLALTLTSPQPAGEEDMGMEKAPLR